MRGEQGRSLCPEPCRCQRLGGLGRTLRRGKVRTEVLLAPRGLPAALGAQRCLRTLATSPRQLRRQQDGALSTLDLHSARTFCSMHHLRAMSGYVLFICLDGKPHLKSLLKPSKLRRSYNFLVGKRQSLQASEKLHLVNLVHTEQSVQQACRIVTVGCGMVVKVSLLTGPRCHEPLHLVTARCSRTACQLEHVSWQMYKDYATLLHVLFLQ